MAARLPKTLAGMYADIKRRYVDNWEVEIPEAEEVEFHWVDPGGQTDLIDTLCTWASAFRDDDGVWHVSFNDRIRTCPDFMYIVLAHEMLHIAYPDAAHNDATWNEGYRRFVGAGLFRRVF